MNQNREEQEIEPFDAGAALRAVPHLEGVVVERAVVGAINGQNTLRLWLACGTVITFASRLDLQDLHPAPPPCHCGCNTRLACRKQAEKPK